MSDHTPGPWVFEDPKDLPHPMGMLAILAFKCGSMPQTSGCSIARDEMNANRALASAAPDMLAALKAVLPRLRAMGSSLEGQVSAAIAKAEGHS